MWGILKRKRVYINIYINNKLADLNMLTDHHLIELRNAVMKLLNTKEDSIIRYEANVYTQYTCCSLPKIIFEVECYKISKYGTTLHSLPEGFIDNMIGKRKVIYPEKELIKTWGGVLEAELVSS